jgi:acyl carrier protein
MLNPAEVRATVFAEISAILLEETDETIVPTGAEDLSDIGFHSLLLARLVVQLEAAVGADPFVAGDDSIVDVRTVDELAAAYERAVVEAAGVPAVAAA